MGAGIVRIRDGRVTAFCTFAANGDIGGMGAILRIDRSVLESEALECAAKNGQLEAIDLLINERIDIKAHGAASLIVAAVNNQLEAVKRLVERGVNAKSIEALISSAEAGHVGVVKFFLENGTDPNREGERGRFALKESAGNNHIAVMNALMDYNADVNKLNGSWQTALMEAAYYNRLEAAELLVERHANTYVKDKEKRDALFIAKLCDSTEVRDFLEKQMGRNPLTKARRAAERAAGKVKESVKIYQNR